MDAPPVKYATTSDGVSVAYAVSGTGPPLVFLTMPMYGHLQQEWQVPVLRRFYERLSESWTLIRYDGRGTGLSQETVTDFSYRALVLDLEAIVDDLGLRQVALFGYGTQNTPIPVNFAVRYPERVSHLALIHPVVSSMELDSASASPAIKMLAEHWDVYAAAVPEFFNIDDPESRRAFAEVVRTSSSAEIYRAVVSQGFDLAPSLAELRVPTLAISIARSPVPNAVVQSFAVSVSGAQLVALDEDMLESEGGSDHVASVIADFMGGAQRHSQRPGGFSTILFTDVVSSTPLLTQLRDERMREVMHDHDAVCESAITRHGGRVVKTIGDAFMAEFSVPSAAIEAAIAIQRGIREQFEGSDVPVRLRIGINAGEPIVEDDDLHGASVVIAKRLESEADAEGILISDVVRQAVVGKDFEFEDRGEVELKGFDQPVRAWVVRWDQM